MASPKDLLLAVAKSDNGAGLAFNAALALDLYEQDRRFLQEVAKACFPLVLEETAQRIAKRAIGDQIAKARSGGYEGLDPAVVDQYSELMEFSQEIKKYGWDSFQVQSGSTVRVYRDNKGRFSSPGGKNKADVARATGQASIANKFVPRGEQPGAGQFRLTRAQQRRASVSRSGRLVSIDQSAAPTDRETAARVLRSSYNANAPIQQIRDRLADHDVDPDANIKNVKLRIQMQEPSTGDRVEVVAPYDRDSQTFEIPDAFSTYDVVDDDNAIVAFSEKKKVSEALGEYTDIDVMDLVGEPSTRSPLNSTFGDRTKRRSGIAATALRAVGKPEAANAVENAGKLAASVDESSLRTGIARTAYRYRAVEAAHIGDDIKASLTRASTPAAPKEQWDEYRGTGGGKWGRPNVSAPAGFPPEVDRSRLNYYRNSADPDMLNNPEARESAIAMGRLRDGATNALYNRMQRRQSNAGMDVHGTLSSANYNKLAQKIASNIGRGMPSEGVIIDKDGKAVAQSMGITHDGFTPFNADGLSKLSGGQYVRTRQLGGFTGEDIRTLVIGNGRAAQVLSNSGVYELEMAPTARGTRRYNDKVLQMVDTYDRILDEIAYGGHYAVPLPPEAEKKARQLAAQRSGGDAAKYGKELPKARNDQYNAIAQLSDSEIKGVRQKVEPTAKAEFVERFGVKGGGGSGKVLAPGDEGKMREFIENRVEQEVRTREGEKARMLQLNSEGYALALKTLSQYYPYMIRTARYRSWETYNDEHGIGSSKRSSGGADDWATPAGYLRPPKDEKDATNAMLGKPIKRKGPYSTKNGEIKRNKVTTITPGLRSGGSSSSVGGTGGALSGPLAQVVTNRRQSMMTEAQRAISSIENINPEGDRLTDEVVLTGGDMTKRIRAAYEVFARDPNAGAAVLADPQAAEVLRALVDPNQLRNLAANTDDPMRRGGSPVTAEQLREVGKYMNTVAALTIAENRSEMVSPDVDINALPDKRDSFILAGDAETAPALQRAMSAPTGNAAIGLYRNVSGAAGLTDDYVGSNVVLEGLEELRAKRKQALSGDASLGPNIQAAVEQWDQSGGGDLNQLSTILLGSEKAKLAAQAGTGSSQTRKAVVDDDTWEQYKRLYQYGRGLALQQSLVGNLQHPGARTDPKVRPPLGGQQVGKSDRPVWSPEQDQAHLEALRLLA